MKHTVKRSSLFLTELVLSLLIFIICAFVCISLLVSSYSISRDSTALTQATFAAEQAAEDWKANVWPRDNSALRFYDEDWQLTEDSNTAAYTLTFTVDPAQSTATVDTATIAVDGTKGAICTLTVSRLKEGLLHE